MALLKALICIGTSKVDGWRNSEIIVLKYLCRYGKLYLETAYEVNEYKYTYQFTATPLRVT